MSGTSASKKSRATQKDSQPTTPDLLAMVQAMLAKAGEAPGIKVEFADLFGNGEKQAGIIITGAHWEAGNLVPNAGNAGAVVNSDAGNAGNPGEVAE
jgi:hypothetical protein